MIIIGAGGLGTEAVWVAADMNRAGTPCGSDCWEILGYADDDAHKSGSFLSGYPVLGTISEVAARLSGVELYYCCAIGNNQSRLQIVEQVISFGWLPATLIHPTVIVAPGTVIHPGTYVAPGVIVGPNALVGSHVILNSHVSVGHDSRIGDFAQACPGARISGGCVVEQLAFLGSNASLSPGVTVGRGAKVGANSFVLRSVRPGVTAIGIPALAIA